MIQWILVSLLQHLLNKYHVEHDAKVSFFLSSIRDTIYPNIHIFNLVPLVTTLVGGDLHALQLIFDDLKNQIPVVIVDVSCTRFLNGSGMYYFLSKKTAKWSIS
jgi:hypothetical protein